MIPDDARKLQMPPDESSCLQMTPEASRCSVCVYMILHTCTASQPGCQVSSQPTAKPNIHQLASQSAANVHASRSVAKVCQMNENQGQGPWPRPGPGPGPGTLARLPGRNPGQEIGPGPVPGTRAGIQARDTVCKVCKTRGEGGGAKKMLRNT